MDPQAAKLVGAGLAAIGAGMAAIGVGNVFGSFLEGALRNPAEAPRQFGLALRRVADWVERRLSPFG